MQNITSYLLLPEQARWAKEKGFYGDCDYFFRGFRFAKHPIRVSYSISNKRYVKYKAFTVPTFEQFFDWVEEKWGIWVVIERRAQNGYMWDINPSRFSPSLAGGIQKDKRSARIACVNEIIKHIDNLKK